MIYRYRLQLQLQSLHFKQTYLKLLNLNDNGKYISFGVNWPRCFMIVCLSAFWKHSYLLTYLLTYLLGLESHNICHFIYKHVYLQTPMYKRNKNWEKVIIYFTIIIVYLMLRNVSREISSSTSSLSLSLWNRNSTTISRSTSINR